MDSGLGALFCVCGYVDMYVYLGYLGHLVHRELPVLPLFAVAILEWGIFGWWGRTR
jgi:hypothetical protein